MKNLLTFLNGAPSDKPAFAVAEKLSDLHDVVLFQ
jgi:hypothetical protein